jgi:hypothetical protein
MKPLLEDFLKHSSGPKEFPLPFCNHRWLENINVCDRMHEPLCNYVKAVEQGKCPNPKTKSFEEVCVWIRDPLYVAKLYFFNYVALPVETFLSMYQTDKPMIMFVSGDLELLLRDLVKRFIIPELLKEASTVRKLFKLNLSDPSLHMSSKNIDVGFSTERELKAKLKEKCISERDQLEFKMDCKDCYTTLI